MVARDLHPDDHGEDRHHADRPDSFTIIAGPCAVESEEQALTATRAAKAAGATMLRGDVYKPRTSPYSFQGLGERGLEILQECRRQTGLPFIVEVVDVSHVELVAEVADCIRVGTRNAQNFELLKEVGLANKPVMLKRGLAMTVEEWLQAAEYVAQRGNSEVILCERGIRTFEPSTRNTLDLGGMAVAQHESHLPVIVDPSHAVGIRSSGGADGARRARGRRRCGHDRRAPRPGGRAVRRPAGARRPTRCSSSAASSSDRGGARPPDEPLEVPRPVAATIGRQLRDVAAVPPSRRASRPAVRRGCAAGRRAPSRPPPTRRPRACRTGPGTRPARCRGACGA